MYTAHYALWEKYIVCAACYSRSANNVTAYHQWVRAYHTQVIAYHTRVAAYHTWLTPYHTWVAPYHTVDKQI